MAENTLRYLLFDWPRLELGMRHRKCGKFIGENSGCVCRWAASISLIQQDIEGDVFVVAVWR